MIINQIIILIIDHTLQQVIESYIGYDWDYDPLSSEKVTWENNVGILDNSKYKIQLRDNL
jgi:hypothetical protein